MEQYTNDWTCLVIDCNAEITTTTSLKDMIFYYKAESHNDFMIANPNIDL